MERQEYKPDPYSDFFAFTCLWYRKQYRAHFAGRLCCLDNAELVAIFRQPGGLNDTLAAMRAANEAKGN